MRVKLRTRSTVARPAQLLIFLHFTEAHVSRPAVQHILAADESALLLNQDGSQTRFLNKENRRGRNSSLLGNQRSRDEYSPQTEDRCQKYWRDEESGCGWTREWTCPHQPWGSQRKADAGNNGTDGYDCCCTLEMWRGDRADDPGAEEKCKDYMSQTGCGWTEEHTCPKTGQPYTSKRIADANPDDTLGFECCCSFGLWSPKEAKESSDTPKWEMVAMPAMAAAATVLGTAPLWWVREGEELPPGVMAFSLTLAAGFMLAVSVHMLTSLSEGRKALDYKDAIAFCGGATICGLFCCLSHRCMSSPEPEAKPVKAKTAKEATKEKKQQKKHPADDNANLYKVPEVSEDRRVDPDDGMTYTLAEFTIKYEGVYSEPEAQSYFLNHCTPATPPATTATEAPDTAAAAPDVTTDSSHAEQDHKVSAPANSSRLGSIMLVTLCAHNIPEGAAVAIAASLTEPTLGISLMLAVALHNVPEGAALCIALYRETKSFWKSFSGTCFCGLMELLGAVLALIFIQGYDRTPDELVLMLTAVAGIMCYVAAFEILPEVVSTGEWMAIILGFLISFACYFVTMEVIKGCLDDGRTAVIFKGAERRWII